MSKKIIVFDVDGVIIDSAQRKLTAFSQVVRDYGLSDNSRIIETLNTRVSRNILAEKIYEVSWINTRKTLMDISRYLALYESKWNMYPVFSDTLVFIERYYEKYLFFTNTAMHSSTTQDIFQKLWILNFFEEILGYDTWTKRENIQYLLREYTSFSKNILFLDDLQQNIDEVIPTWVHTLLFSDDWVSLEEKVQNIFWT